MTPFLQQVATLFFNRYGTEIHRLAFVFPNRRSGVFFRKYLSQEAGKPLFSPTILTINGLFLQLCDKQPADHIRMLFLLYRIYIRQSGSKETFDDFVYWGEMLLNDFDDVDKYLVDAKRLFTNVVDLHTLDKDFEYLHENQIDAIRAFWSSFHPKGDGVNQQHFLDIWTLLYAIYSELKESLAAEGTGYEGMLFREVVEQIKQSGECDLPYDKVVFVGLNALSAVETELLLLFQKQGIADFYWDCGSKQVMDADNKASFFIRERLKMFPSTHELPEEEVNEPEIELTGIPSRIGQAKQVYSLLEEMLGKETNPEEAIRTAIVLPDEQLLIPVLNSIPKDITRINVTLGYPLSGTPVASLIESVLALQKNVRTIDGQPFFYHREVLSVLNHQYILSACPDIITSLTREIMAQNKIHIAAQDLNRTPLFSIIFSPVNEARAISDYLLLVLQELNKAISALHPEKEEDEALCMDELEQEFVYHYFTTVNRMRDLIQAEGLEMSVETYFRLLKRLTDTITIPFEGEPLSGLQVMGVLETRVLDFERLIILSVNEGVFPVKTVANSFIPYNLRRGFGLPTYEHQDSIWAYHFYRLIARAKQVHLLYDTRTDGLQTGEVSRFVHQLRYHYETPVKEKLMVYQISSSQSPAIRIDKTAEVMTKLGDYMPDGVKALSASTINTCLDCSLRFYFASIEGLKEEDEVAESVESQVFGNILHKVMEWLYQPLCGAQVTADLLKLTAKETTLTDAIHRAFAELFFHSKEVRSLNGQNYLTGEMIRKYVLKILERDRQLTPFRYIRSEKKMLHSLTLTDGRVIRLKGFIDRLDEVNGTIRIVDYKTGIKKMLDFKTIESLFDKTNEKRQSAIMQVFMYSWMYSATVDSTMPVQPVIYYLRDLFSDDFNPSIYCGKEKKLVADFAIYHTEFEDALRQCLDEIFNPDIPFTQTSNSKVCAYCPFANVCGR